jgi:Protein of unknown function (DUF3667)
MQVRIVLKNYLNFLRIHLLMNCKSCGASLEPAYRFCPACGELAYAHRLDIKHVIEEFIHAFVHADKGIFLLVKQLVVAPGKTALAYINGSRKKFFNPVSFLLIAGGISFFLRDKLETNMPAGSKKMAHLIGEFVHRYTTPIIILTVPVLSFYSWLFFKSSGKNYAENMVVNMYMMGEYHLFTILSFILPVVFAPQLSVFFTLASFLVMAVYYFITCRNFYGFGSSRTLTRIIVIELLYLLTTTVLMGIAMIIFFIQSGLHIKDLKQ